MHLKSTFLLLSIFIASHCFCQFTLTTAASNNGSGGVFFRLTANSLPINLMKLNTYFSSASGTPVSVQVYSRDGDYTGFTAANTGWTLLATINTTSAGTTTLAPIDLTSLNVQIAPSAAKSFYIHSITTGGGIRYTGVTATPPVTTYSDANVTLFSDVARTGNVAFAGTQFSPRAFSGSIEYNIGAVPLTWLNISAKNQQNTVLITFEVEEINVFKYEIEMKSLNQNVKIATINSRGDGRNTYTFTDANAFANGNITATYRVKQIDHDGKYTYSTTVAARKLSGRNLISVRSNRSMVKL